MVVNGKTFRLSREKLKILDHHIHGDKFIFKEVDEKKIDEDIDYIIKNIGKFVNKKKMLKEILKKFNLEQIKKIKKMLSEKKPIKETNGCYGLTIGDDSSGAVISLA